jgi:hypothetical protein
MTMGSVRGWIGLGTFPMALASAVTWAASPVRRMRDRAGVVNPGVK